MKIDDLLNEMAAQQASDLYIKTGVPPMLRVSGQLFPIGTEPLTAVAVEELASVMMTRRHQKEFAQRQQVHLAYQTPTLGRYRVNLYTQRSAPAIVIRRIKSEIPSFEELGLPPATEKLAVASRGLILVTGPSGSGKSTTLAALIDHRNRHAAGHIVTIEDPIEFVHTDRQSLVSQREVGIDCESFADALQDVLWQAPDVILIGEIRDMESAKAAVHFAETGHLVLSTLHATNAPQAIEHMLHFFPPDAHATVRMQLSLNLLAVVSQRLILKWDGTGVVLALELLLVTPHVRDLLRTGNVNGLRAALQSGTQEGMQSFDQAIFSLIQEGTIDAETGLQYADSSSDLRLRLRGMR